jgi:dCMP deaminase
MEGNRCKCGALQHFGGEAGWYCDRGLKCSVLLWQRFERPSWDEWGLNLAKAVATRADCSRAKHGAVILSVEHRVVATGYNGYPKGQRGCLAGGCPRGSLSAEQLPHLAPYHEGIGRCDAIHAEANALLHADWLSVQGGTMYITGQPCHGCLVLIKGSGLRWAIWPTGNWELAA